MKVDVACLQQVARRSLEEWAMMFVEEAVAHDSLQQGEELYAARLAFEGVVSGQVEVMATRRLMRLLAANVLGEDEETIDEALCEDSLKELANVITGNVLTSHFGTGRVFHLMPPTCVAATDAQRRALFASREWQSFLADEEFVAVSLHAHTGAD